ncbi:putative cytochrome P450 [Glonium stellatum]|uniref:Putative cytochrome P450 n=1 Tax=Glonium stellatum TaxID=574774 RepID=A0A8E2JQI4_9PEZI|nr:putative cytochrome P450 [Glonium stellatum]
MKHQFDVTLAVFGNNVLDPKFNIWVCFSLGLASIILYSIRWKGPRVLPDVYVAGLEDGKRTIAEARKKFVASCAEIMLEGYQRTQGGFFYVPSPAGERLMIPTRYIEELKNSPDDSVDFTGSFLEMFMGRYTTIGMRWHLHPGVVKKSLNSNLAAIMPSVEEEIYHAFETTLPPFNKNTDWTSVVMADKFVDIISRASNRMLGGKALSRNAEWTATSINFTTDAWLASQRLKQFHPLLRPIVQHWIPEMAKVKHHGVVARRVINPIVESRLTRGEKPLDLLQMLWEGAQGKDKTPDFMAYTALAISFAAIRTSSSVPTHLLYDLCARPEYIEPLRQEIETVLAEEGSFTKSGLNKLIKLDSFMKESQRFNPLSFLTFGRVIHQDLTLYDGFTIPAGTMIGIPAHAISQDSAFYPSPSTFSGFRFVPDLSSPSTSIATSPEKALPQFVTTNASNLSWGYGKHACSGRFFAANEIKIIVAHFLLNYDFKFASSDTQRPKNLAYELQNEADPTIKVLLKKRDRKVGGG